MAKESYNPFKMWGSYVGAIIYILLFSASNNYFFPTMQNLLLRITPFIGRYCVLAEQTTSLDLVLVCGVQITLVVVIIGFLIGWGIHSLIRRFSN